MEDPGGPGPGAWPAWLPAGLPAPPPGWGGWEPRALAAAALATAVVVLASRFVLASLLSKTLSKQGTRIQFRALSLFAVSGILVTSATGPVARLSIDGVRVHRRKLINMLWAKLYSPRSATVEIPVVVRGVRLSLRKPAAGPAGGAKPGKAAKKGPPLDANQIEEILGSLNGKWHGAVLLALARILRITVSDVVVDASPLCGVTIGLGGIDVRVLRHRQELRVSLKVATSQADFIDADAGRTYDNSLLDTAVPLCLVDDLTVYSVVERGPERRRYVCSSVEATCKRAIFALSRRLLEQAGQAREAKGDGKGGGGAEGEGGKAGPARTLKRTLSSEKRVRQAMQALQGLVESFKLSVPVVEVFCAPDIPYLHGLDYSGSVREFTVFYKRSEDSLAAILQADEDPGR